MNKPDQDEDDDLMIVKVEKKPGPKAKASKTMASWVSSSFDSFTAGLPQRNKTPLRTSQSLKVSGTKSKSCKKDMSSSQTIFESFSNGDSSRKRSRSLLESKPPASKKSLASNLWAEVYSPTTRADLAVHKKKVEDIFDWLTRTISNKKHKAPILVLSGPPGAGKTACFNVLCQEMGVSLQQWENPVSFQTGEDFSTTTHQDRSKVDVYSSQSQATQFSNFLLRANKYSPLACLGSHPTQSDTKNSNKSVILVEELPNIFHRDQAQLHTILRKYQRTGQSPLVFIITESNSFEGSVLKMFPKDLQSEIRMSHINVNPVAPTMMMKCLNRVISLNSGQKNCFTPSQSVLEIIAQGCSGDVRAALNMLQFACSKQESLSLSEMKESGGKLNKKGSVSSRLKGHRGKSKTVAVSEESQSIVGVKDTNVFLFQAVGKILYFKRGDPVEFPDHKRLPDYLSSHDRDPLLLEPEEIVSKVHISPDFFTSFLHENYVNFVDSVEDLERASEYFSDADYISSIWTGRQELENYSISVTTRGFIHSNSAMTRHDSVRKNQGWRPLHKSQWYPAMRQAQQNSLSGKQLFKGNHWEPEVLCTEVIPFIHFTNPTLHDPGQISFVQQMTHFSGRNTFRSRAEQLNEKEAVEEDEEDFEEVAITTDKSMNKAECLKGSEVSSDALVDVDEAEWGSDWAADDEDLLGSQSNVKVTVEEDQVDFVIDEFDD